jgi:aspartate/glutamate racemase
MKINKITPIIGIIGETKVVNDYQTRIAKISQHSPVRINTLGVDIDFSKIDPARAAGNWKQVANILNKYALELCESGADSIVLAHNGLHRAAPGIIKGNWNRNKWLPVAFIDAVFSMTIAILRTDIRRIGLIGQNSDFYIEELKEWNIDVVLPPKSTMENVHKIIKSGNVENESKYLHDVCQRLIQDHKVDGIVLGCNHLGDAIKPNYGMGFNLTTGEIHENDSLKLHETKIVRLFDSAQTQIQIAVEHALSLVATNQK